MCIHDAVEQLFHQEFCLRAWHEGVLVDEKFSVVEFFVSRDECYRFVIFSSSNEGIRDVPKQKRASS